jgi:F0F1-type ATP synthase membrane subunit b/b'
MSVDAIKSISDTEDDARIAKSEAVLKAKRAVEDAEKAGQESVVSAVRNAEAKVRELRAAAAQSISDRVKALAAVTENECEELKASVSMRLEHAAQAIVEVIIAERTVTG